MGDNTKDSYDSQFEAYLKKSESSSASINSSLIDNEMQESATSFQDFFKNNVQKSDKYKKDISELSELAKPVNKFLKHLKTTSSTPAESSNMSSINKNSLTVVTEGDSNMGLDTLEEIKEKQLFFKQLEENNSESTLDYGKLNQQLNVSDTLLIPLAPSPIEIPVNMTIDEDENDVYDIKIDDNSDDNENDLKKEKVVGLLEDPNQFQSDLSTDQSKINKNPKSLLAQVGLDSLDSTFHKEPIKQNKKSILKTDYKTNDKNISIDKNNDYDSDDANNDHNVILNNVDDEDINEIDYSNNEEDDDNDYSDNDNDNNQQGDLDNYETNKSNVKSALSFTDTSHERDALRNELKKIGKFESLSNTVLDIHNASFLDSLDVPETLEKLETVNSSSINKSNIKSFTNSKKPSKILSKQTRFKNVQSSGYGPKPFRYTLNRSEKMSVEDDKIENNEPAEIIKPDEVKTTQDKNNNAECIKYELEINNLKQENFILYSKLEGQKHKIDSFLANKGSKEENELEKLLKEEKYLRRGYEVENEKMYVENKGLREELRNMERAMFAENQKLRNELANTKEELASKEAQLAMHRVNLKSSFVSGSAMLGAERISQLESLIAKAKEKEIELKDNYDALLEEKNKAENFFRNEINVLKNQLKDEANRHTSSIEKLNIEHGKNLEILNKKIKWLVENQQLLGRDSMALKQKNMEITKMRGILKELEEKLKVKMNTTEMKKKSKQPPPHSLKQVGVIEKNIRNRRSHSTAALKSNEIIISPGEREFLEEQIKILEERLEERDEGSSRSLRIMQQKFSSLQLQYEERISHLEDLLRTHTQPQVDSNTHANVNSFNKEVAAMRLKHKQAIIDLEIQVNKLQKELWQYKGAVIAKESNCGQENKKQTFFTNENILADNQILQEQVEKLSKLVTDRTEEVKSLRLQLDHNKEDHHLFIEKIKLDHQTELKNNLATSVLNNQTSNLTRLHNVVSTQETVINHLKEEIIRHKMDGSKLTMLSNNNVLLNNRIQQLNQDLLEARTHHTPEMQHIWKLQERIRELEERGHEREKLLNKLSNRPQYILEAVEEERDKWQSILNKKSEELDRFQQELEVILNVVQTLKDNGSIGQNDSLLPIAIRHFTHRHNR